MTIHSLDLSTVGIFGPLGNVYATSVAQTAWGTANRANGGWIIVPQTVIVDAIKHADTIGSGNTDVGITDEAGNLLASSGSTAASTGNRVDVLDAEVELAPGVYYLWMACSSTTQRTLRASFATLGQCRATGAVEAASSFPLPDPITIVPVSATTICIPVLSLRIAGAE